MASFQKFNAFVADAANKVHNLGSDTLKILLTDTAPVATNAVKANLTEIGAGNGYAAGGGAVTITSSAQSGGTYKLVGNNVTFTAAGGSIAQFRYAVIYNSTAASGNLIGWWDYGTEVNVTNGNRSSSTRPTASCSWLDPMKLYNLARMTSATAGTGTLTLGVAVSGYLTFALAGVADGDVVLYGIKDGANSEVGWGTYTASGTTLSRNVYKSTNSNALISCSGSQEVYVTALGADGGDLLPGSTTPMRGFDTPINLQFNASVASNVLTIAVKGNNGADPSTTNPVTQIRRGTTTGLGSVALSGGFVGRCALVNEVLDAPGTTSSTTYTVYALSVDNTNSGDIQYSSQPHRNRDHADRRDNGLKSCP
jgi:hypothetical protein